MGKSDNVKVLDENKIKIEIEIPETLAARIFSAGTTPTEFFKELANRIQNSDDISEWISSYPDTTVTKSENKRRIIAFKDKRTHLKEWTQPDFNKYMNFLFKSKQKNLDIILLLGTYVKLGPLPKSIDIQREIGITENEIWFREFRAMKARLTIYAKKMGFQSFFQRAQGMGRKRFHPIDSDIHKWLMEWAQEHKSFLGLSEIEQKGGSENE